MSDTGLGLRAQPSSDPQAGYRQQVELAKARIKASANWFDWIAALSVVNAVIALSNSNWHFLLGLGVTDVVNYLARKSGSGQAQVIGLVVTLVVAGIFWLMGRFAKQGQYWALIVGMILYTLDGGLLLIGQDWLSAAFHVYALFMLSRTFGAIKAFEAAKQDAEAHGVFLGLPTS
ncbi:MAG TPA: hypothetical protein VKL40_11660 [Candidatus Angelobacter sp.]|nr:hypothetical protein [Candidatus Angelobacter sp.]